MVQGDKDGTFEGSVAQSAVTWRLDVKADVNVKVKLKCQKAQGKQLQKKKRRIKEH